MKKNVLLLSLLMVVMLLGACSNKTKKSENEKNINKNETSLYLIRINKDKLNNNQTNLKLPNESNVGGDIAFLADICSGKLIEIKISGKLSPQEALEKLFNYKTDLKNGMYNAFSESKNIKIDKLIIKNNFAIVTLAGDIKTNEMCGGQLMHDQIVKTLSQFDNIAGADVFVGNEEINSYLSKAENK